VAGEIHHAFHVVGDHLAHRVDRPVVVHHRAGCGVFRRRRLLEVEQVGGELHRADAVGHDMVGLHHERRAVGVAVVAHTLDEGELPQRAGAVEATHRCAARPVEQFLLAAAGGQADVAQVVVEVEVGVGLPAHEVGVQRHRHHLLAQGGHMVGDLLDAAVDAIPRGRGVEQHHPHDRGAQQWIGLDHPHQGVGLAEI
jgi:hypothetical protein